MSSLSVLSGSDFGPGDAKQDAAIGQRRALEAERLKRVKDPKLRTMGIDTQALTAQVEEKEAMTDAQKQLDSAYDQQRMLMDQQLAYLEQERLRAERSKAQAQDDFRSTYQGKEKGREFDLNDPSSKLNDQPARVGDDDPRLSVSGMQQFLGEDVSYAHRVKRQQEEMKGWFDEVRLSTSWKCAANPARPAHRGSQPDRRSPMRCHRSTQRNVCIPLTASLDRPQGKRPTPRLRRRQRLRHTPIERWRSTHTNNISRVPLAQLAQIPMCLSLNTSLHRYGIYNFVVCLDVLWGTCCGRRVTGQRSAYPCGCGRVDPESAQNPSVPTTLLPLWQAAAKREKDRAQQMSELQDNIEEIQANLAGDLLTENPAIGRSFVATNRVRPDHYKGMSPAEQESVLQEQVLLPSVACAVPCFA